MLLRFLSSGGAACTTFESRKFYVEQAEARTDWPLLGTFSFVLLSTSSQLLHAGARAHSCVHSLAWWARFTGCIRQLTCHASRVLFCFFLPIAVILIMEGCATHLERDKSIAVQLTKEGKSKRVSVILHRGTTGAYGGSCGFPVAGKTASQGTYVPPLPQHARLLLVDNETSQSISFRNRLCGVAWQADC